MIFGVICVEVSRKFSKNPHFWQKVHLHSEANFESSSTEVPSPPPPKIALVSYDPSYFLRRKNKTFDFFLVFSPRHNNKILICHFDWFKIVWNLIRNKIWTILNDFLAFSGDFSLRKSRPKQLFFGYNRFFKAQFADFGL